MSCRGGVALSGADRVATMKGIRNIDCGHRVTCSAGPQICKLAHRWGCTNSRRLDTLIPLMEKLRWGPLSNACKSLNVNFAEPGESIGFITFALIAIVCIAGAQATTPSDSKPKTPKTDQPLTGMCRMIEFRRAEIAYVLLRLNSSCSSTGLADRAPRWW